MHSNFFSEINALMVRQPQVEKPLACICWITVVLK